MKNKTLCPAQHKLVMVTYQKHPVLAVYTLGGAFLGVLDFDLSWEEIGEWATLFHLGALTTGDLW